MIRAELAGGEMLTFDDDTPDDVVHAAVLRHVNGKKSVASLIAALERNTEAMKENTAATLAPREIKVNRDLSGDKVIGARSEVDNKETRH